MNIFRTTTSLSPLIACIACIASILLSACKTPEPRSETPVTSEPISERAQPEPEQKPLTSEERAQLVKQNTLEAIEKLQSGDEAAAKILLNHVVAVEPGNELASKLLDQINADAQQKLGSASFPYVVQRDDTLGKLAQRFLNDRYQFYILAKYNDITVPNKLAFGQTIRIPGQPRKAPVTSQKPAPTPVEPRTRPSEPPTPYRDQNPTPATTESPKTPPLSSAADEVRQNAIRRLSRDAEACQRRQDLDCSIQKWTQVLELDPDNQSAILKRERAATLKRQLQEMNSK